MNQNVMINDSFEILTPTGWQNFSGIKKSKQQTLKIKFQSGLELCCTEHHRFIHNEKIIHASELKPKFKIGKETVVSINLHEEIYVYDPINVENGNLYYADNLISHNCKFLGSSLTLVAADTIAQLSPKSPIYSKDGLDVYENVQKDHIYTIVADTAKGVGGDYSAFSVIDCTEMPYQVVAKYRNNTISPLLYPSVLYRTGKEFNNAYVLIELNSSEQVAEILYSEYEYENVIFVNRTTQGQVVSGGFGGGKSQLGVVTDRKVKRIGCSNFKSLVEEKKLLIHDIDTISEISTFIEKRGTYAADEGYNDDLVMGLVLFSWLTTNSYFKELTNINIRKELYDKRIQMIEEEMTPFGIIDDGIEDEQFVDKNGQVWETYKSDFL